MIDEPTLERGLRARPPGDPVYRSRLAAQPPDARSGAVARTRPALPTTARLIVVLALTGLGALTLLLAAGGGPSPAPAPTPSPTPMSSAAALASATAELLDGFIAARVAGEGAEASLDEARQDVPLLYASGDGARWERGEWEPVEGVAWPYGVTAFRVRLFAGDTVLEQLVFLAAGERPLRLGYWPESFGTELPPTTEDGRSVPVTRAYFGGEVTLEAGHPWIMSDQGFLPFGRLIPAGPAVTPTTDGGQRNGWDHLYLMADPPPIGTGCAVGPEPADARALVDRLLADPGLEATAPVTVPTAAGDAWVVDVTLPAGAPVCAAIRESGDLADRPGILFPVFDFGRQTVVPGTSLVTGGATGWRMRLTVADAPAGSSMRILAIAVVAPEATFERAVEQAAPIVASLAFHPGRPDASPAASAAP